MKPVYHHLNPPEGFEAMLFEFRQLLHQHPEVSGTESDTPRLIQEFISRFSPDRVIAPIGGNGLAAVYYSDDVGPTLLFRAEIDALPIGADTGRLPSGESTSIPAAHRCGHDGHMAAVAGLAPLLHANPLRSGRVVLLFQPAEETGQGARQIVDDPGFAEITPDLVFAWHNLPGYPLGEVLVKSGLINYASAGMHLRLMGKEAHASQPEKGISPAPVMCELINGLSSLSASHADDEALQKSLVTIVHAQIGDKSYGTAPGRAELMATLRASSTERLQRLQSKAVDVATRCAAAGGIQADVSWSDEFAACRNSKTAAKILADSAVRSGLNVRWLTEAFRWSEDFGQFTARHTGAMLMIGAGVKSAPLHSQGYEFPDALLEPAVAVFWNIIDSLVGDSAS